MTTKLASLLGLNVPETVLADYMSMIIENMVSSIPEAFAKAGSEL